MKPLDGIDQTPFQNQYHFQTQPIEFGMSGIGQLVEALTLQAQAIDRLAASNEALVDAMMALGERDEEPDPDDVVRTYMDGSPTGH